MKIILLVFLLFLSLKAEFLDDDVDGVENSFDKCPNTPFLALVDKYGCTTKKLSLSEAPHYSIAIGYFYAKDKYTQNSNFIDFSFYYKNFSGYIEGSRSSIDSQSEQDDTTIALSYHYNGYFNYIFGVGVYLPTDSKTDNKTDYYSKITVSYKKIGFDTSITYKRIFMHDDSTVDTNSYTLEAGYYFSNKLYSSISFYQTNSIYNKNDSLKYLTLYTSYYISKNFYLTGSVSKGLNIESIDKSYSLSIGYDFQ